MIAAIEKQAKLDSDVEKKRVKAEQEDLKRKAEEKKEAMDRKRTSRFFKPKTITAASESTDMLVEASSTPVMPESTLFLMSSPEKNKTPLVMTVPPTQNHRRRRSIFVRPALGKKVSMLGLSFFSWSTGCAWVSRLEKYGEI